MTKENNSLKKLPTQPRKVDVYLIYKNRNVKRIRKFINELQRQDNVSINAQYLTKSQFIKVLEHFGVPEDYQPFSQIEE